MKKLLAAAGVFCMFAAFSCTKQEENPGGEPGAAPELSLSSSDESVVIGENSLEARINADCNGLTASVDVVTTADEWTITEGPEWVSVTVSSDKAVFEILSNEAIESRSAAYTVSASNENGTVTAVINVAQGGVAAAELTVEPAEVAIAAGGGRIEVSFTTNQTAVEVSVDEKDGWLSYEKGDGVITFSAEANNADVSRSAAVTVTAGAGENTATAAITVTQDFVAAELNVGLSTAAIAAEGVSAEVSYTSNYPVEVKIPAGADWLASETSDGTITFSAGANDTDSERTAEVVITAGQGSNTATATVTVSQDFVPAAKGLVFVVRPTSTSKVLSLPTLSTNDGTKSFTVDYGDNAVETYDGNLSSAITHTYESEGDYTVTITTDNVISAFSFNGNARLIRLSGNSLNMSGVTSLKQAFYNCRQLEAVEAGALAPCVNTTDIENIFYGCTSLKEIGEGLFAGMTSLKAAKYVFSGCSSLTAAPAKLFAGCSAVTEFTSLFYNCSKLESVAADIFEGCSAVTGLRYTFADCLSLKSIPAGLFKDCTAVRECYATFNGCSSLAEIPADLFSGMTNLGDMEYTFSGCRGLTSLPVSLFDNCRKITDFSYTFYYCSNLKGESPYTVIDGNKVHLYERVGYPEAFSSPTSYDDCFSGASELDDFGKIMAAGWGEE